MHYNDLLILCSHNSDQKGNFLAYAGSSSILVAFQLMIMDQKKTVMVTSGV